MKQYLDADVYNEENNALLREEEKLCFEKETLLQMSDEGHNQLEELEKLQGFLNRDQLQTGFSGKLFEEYIKCITVENRNVLIFE